MSHIYRTYLVHHDTHFKSFYQVRNVKKAHVDFRFYDYFGRKHYVDSFFSEFFLSIIVSDPPKNVLKPLNVLKPFLTMLSSYFQLLFFVLNEFLNFSSEKYPKNIFQLSRLSCPLKNNVAYIAKNLTVEYLPTEHVGLLRRPSMDRQIYTEKRSLENE